MTSQKKIGIIGAAGLSGLELIRHLERHPHVQVHKITSSKYAGQSLKEVFPRFLNDELVFEPHNTDVSDCDLLFLAIPNEASMEWVPKLLEQGIRVIDLSGVYRIQDTDIFQKYYKLYHTSADLLPTAVFGLPEFYRKEIPEAQLIANPGCYATGALLGLIPWGSNLKDLTIAPIIDAKSGVSGAGGRVEDDSTNYVMVNENFKAYKVFGHQHMPEIHQFLEQLTPYNTDNLGTPIFTPHLLPLERGILSTIYLNFKKPLDPDAVHQRFASWASEQQFVTLLPPGQFPDLRMVQHSNQCFVGITCDASRQRWVVITALDNLVKGASGQAIQNMNLMLGFPEETSLR